MYFSPHTFKESAYEFKQILIELERLIQKCAVHKKKFEFSVNQFRRFLDSYRQSPNFNQEMKKNQLLAFKDACDQLSKLHQLLLLHQFEGWENSIIEDPSEYVADALCSISQELHNSTAVLYKDGSSYFEYDRLKWVPFHILDIKCIKVSFNKYIESHSNDKEQDINIKKMKLRLSSINKFIDEFNDKNIMKIISPGIRVFSPIPIKFQSWRIQYSDLKLIHKVGEGSSCYVYYGVYKKTGTTVAIKQLKFNQLNGDKLKTFQSEVGILSKTSHPCLLNFVGATDTFPFCIVTDWMPNGTLFDELHNKKQLDPTMRTIALFDVARGMQYLHSKHIVHRDLKSLNVLIDENYHACICDFGFSKDTTEEDLVTRNVGTPFWMAPEISIKQSSQMLSMPNCYTPKVDVYSYGIILWETSSGLFPQTNDSIQARLRIKKPILPFTTPNGVRELFDECCDTNPEKRPSFDEIVRKFTTGKILLNGADEKRFMEYVKETVGTQEIGTIEDKIQSGLNTEKDILELIEALLEEGIPENFSTDKIEICWNSIIRLIPAKVAILIPGCDLSKCIKPSHSTSHKILSKSEFFLDDNNENSNQNLADHIELNQNYFDSNRSNSLTKEEEAKIILVCKVAPLFLQKSIKNNVASLLRFLPARSIPENIVEKIAKMIPSGSEDVDDDIAIASCKNGAADVVAVYSISPEQLKLAFEIVAREGVAVELKTAVADKCIQCLNLQARCLPHAKSVITIKKAEPLSLQKAQSNITLVSTSESNSAHSNIATDNKNNNNNTNISSNNNNNNSTDISSNNINNNNSTDISSNINNNNNSTDISSNINNNNYSDTSSNSNNHNANSDDNNNSFDNSLNNTTNDNISDNKTTTNDNNPDNKSTTNNKNDNNNDNDNSIESEEGKDDSVKKVKLRRSLSVDTRTDRNSRLSYDSMDKQSLTELACSAIRCIVGIGEVRRLSPKTIVQYLACDYAEVRNCFYTVLCSLAMLDLDEEMPIELADIIISNIVSKGDSLFAENALVALAKVSPSVAVAALKKFTDNEYLLKEARRRYEVILKMLMVMMISKNVEFKSVIKNTIEKLDIKNASNEIQSSINILKKYTET